MTFKITAVGFQPFFHRDWSSCHSLCVRQSHAAFETRQNDCIYEMDVVTMLLLPLEILGVFFELCLSELEVLIKESQKKKTGIDQN